MTIIYGKVLYGLILTICINGSCNTTIPESYYSMADCVNVLKEIDKQVNSNNVVSFKCDIIED